jgi:Lsr2
MSRDGGQRRTDYQLELLRRNLQDYNLPFPGDSKRRRRCLSGRSILATSTKSPGAQRITFGLDGKEYRIDLSEEHATELRDFLQKYIQAGEEIPHPTQLSLVGGSGQRRRSAGSSRDDIHEIRQWAEANGYDVSPRGRIKKEIINAYDEAHKSREDKERGYGFGYTPIAMRDFHAGS